MLVQPTTLIYHRQLTTNTFRAVKDGREENDQIEKIDQR